MVIAFLEVFIVGNVLVVAAVRLGMRVAGASVLGV